MRNTYQRLGARRTARQRRRRILSNIGYGLGFAIAGLSIIIAPMFGAWLGGMDVLNAGFFSADGATIADALRWIGS